MYISAHNIVVDTLNGGRRRSAVREKSKGIESGSGRKIIVSVRRLPSGAARRRQKVTGKVTGMAHLRIHATHSLATPLCISG